MFPCPLLRGRPTPSCMIDPAKVSLPYSAQSLCEAGGVGWDSVVLHFITPAEETVDIEVLNPRTVEARRRAKWPPRERTTERGHGLD